MAEFKIDEGVRVLITSTSSADYPQMYILERSFPKDNPNVWEGIKPKFFKPGDIVRIPPNNKFSKLKVTGVHYNEIWKQSTESTPNFEITPPPFIIRYNDSYDDGDFNDLVVTAELIYPNESNSKLGKENFEEFDQNANEGDGIFKEHFKKRPPLDPDPGKGKIPHKIIIEF